MSTLNFLQPFYPSLISYNYHVENSCVFQVSLTIESSKEHHLFDLELFYDKVFTVVFDKFNEFLSVGIRGRTFLF